MSEAKEIDKQLLKAASEGDVAGVQTALKAGADIEAKETYNDTALNLAAEQGHLEAVKVLLEAGANIHNQGGADKTPIKNAAFAGHVVVVRRLLAQGAKVDHDLLGSVQMKVNILEENAENGMVNPQAVEAWKAFLAELVARANEQSTAS
ncbi:MAG: ankyrin repeat domain-containing protein [Deltaproteobacteria bacterium]|nr:ankyrin repeat domain-containing protein [Deltaproteobacteria bacterium]